MGLWYLSAPAAFGDSGDVYAYSESCVVCVTLTIFCSTVEEVYSVCDSIWACHLIVTNAVSSSPGSAVVTHVAVSGCHVTSSSAVHRGSVVVHSSVTSGESVVSFGGVVSTLELSWTVGTVSSSLTSPAHGPPA